MIIPFQDIYKIHILDSKGELDRVFVFCGNDHEEEVSKNQIAKVFSDTQIAYFEANNVDIVFSSQLIYKDDSIRTIKKKIYQEIRSYKKKKIPLSSLDEIYLFASSNPISIPMDSIYKEATKNDTVPFTKERFFQYAMNINANPLLLQDMPNQTNTSPSFSYKNWISLKKSQEMTEIFIPLGMQFQDHRDFLFSANPFHTQIRETAVRYEMSAKNPILSLENTLLLNYTRSTDIMVCFADNVFTFAGEDEEYFCSIYFPLLYNRGLYRKDLLEDAALDLMKETDEKVGMSTSNAVDLFHKIYWKRKSELPYIMRGIKQFSVVLRPTDYEHALPLDILFKNIHSTSEIPFIKMNPGNRRENMYRLYSERISTNGKKIPLLPESKIMSLSRETGKGNQISIYIPNVDNEEIYIHIDSKSRIQITGILKNPLDINVLETLLTKTVNPILQQFNTYLSVAGYTLSTFNHFNGSEIESTHFTYQMALPIKIKINLYEQIPCLSTIFDVIQDDVEKGAQLRFKRVENFSKRNAQTALISEIYNRTGNINDVIESLIYNYRMSKEEAQTRLSNYLSEYQTSSFMENPGFLVNMKIQSLKNIFIEIENINSIEYLDVLHIYIDSILRISQDMKSSGITANEFKQICNKKNAVVIEPSDTENVVVPEGFVIQPLRFGPTIEKEEEDEEGGFTFDDDYDEENYAEEEENDSIQGGTKDDDEEPEEQQYQANIDGMSIKNPTPFFKKMKERDPKLFLTEKQGKFDVYSRVCPIVDKRQPVILTDDEKKQIDEKAPGLYNQAIHYGSDPNNKFWYICPRYWCFKTNSSISEEDVKAGKCGDVIPQNAKVVPKGAYVYEFGNPKEHYDKDGNYKPHIPSFLDSKKHPKGLCIPCCFAKSWNSKQHQELRAKCAQDGAAIPVQATANAGEKQSFYVMSPTLSPLPENRWGFLPLSLQYFLGTDNSLAVTKNNAALIKPDTPCLLRFGIEHSDTQSFLACVAYYYAYKQELEKIPKISEMRNIIADALDLDLFLKYHNGSLVSIFRPKQIEQDAVDIDKHMNTNFAKTIDVNNESQLDFLEETIAAFDNFIEYLKNEKSEIDHTYLWDIVADRNPKLMRDGLNLVILEIMNSDVTNNIQLICPSTTYSQVTYNPSKETIILVKQDVYYEPIQLYQLEGESNVIVKKAFLEHSALKNVKIMLDLIKKSTQKFCHPLASKPQVYKFKQNIIASELVRILRTFEYNIGSQIMNYNKKVIGLCVNKEESQNFVFVPCYPSSVLGGIKIRYMDEDGIWLDYKTTRDRLITINRETGGKVMCLPKLKIMEDKLIVGIMTETNQFIQIDPPAEDVFTDGLNKVEHYDYPIKNKQSVDKTLATNPNPDQDRVKTIHNITIESQFYNVFRSVIRIEMNEFENRALRKSIQTILESDDILYHAKLLKLDKILRQLTKDSVTFQAFDQKTVDAFREITLCNEDEDGKCASDPSKRYCLTEEGNKGCRTIFPKNHLVSGVDNEKVYFGRIADELIRYRRIRLFMFQTKTYLNITNTEYHIDDKELFLLESLLTREYFKDLDPYNRNQYITNIHYDDAQPEESQPYANDLSLSEQFALTQDEEKGDTNMAKYILDCIRETKGRVVGNDKAGSWRPYFPSTAKEIVFMNSGPCSFIPLIYILQQVLKTPISIQNVKTTLWNGYSKLMEVYGDKILNILRKQGKRELIDLVLTRKSTFEHVIFNDEYYITDLDIWVLCNTIQLPVVLFSSTKLKSLVGTVDWLRLGSGKGEPNTKYYFIRSPAIVPPNKPPSYQIISPAFSFHEMKNDMFLRAERGDTTYAENLQKIEIYLAKVN